MKKISTQIVHFIFVGGITTLIDLMVLIFLTEELDMNYLLSNVYSFIISATISYKLSARFVFSAKDSSKNYFAFILLSIFGLVINQIILWCLTSKIGCYYIVSKIVATSVVMTWNFVSKKIYFERTNICGSHKHDAI